jgi:hypothetical protein
MSKLYKTARGKTVDFDKIKLSNEDTTAVGNMRVNARGDLLGAQGTIAAGRNQLMDQVYAVEEAPYSPNDPTSFARTQSIVEQNRAQELHNLAQNLVQTTSPESTPIPDQSSPIQPSARGSLASSVAKTQTVTQAPMPNPKKASGPTRI